MFGLGVLAPLFAVAGIIGASIPLILHLLNRERARQFVFSTLRFIQMSHQTNVRRHKLRRLLLLLLRIFMLALLGLAFARPFFAEAPTIAQKIGGKRNAVIILDTSYSMQYEGVFEQAKKEALTILERLDASDAACLIFSADTARVVAPLGSEVSHIRTALQDAEATYSPTDYLDAMETADEILAPIPIGEKQIYLIADMQKGGWEHFIETDKLNADVSVQFVDVHVESPQNLAITDISVPPVILREQQASYLVARVRNFGNQPVERLPVRLFIDGSLVQTIELDIEPDDLSDGSFRIDFQDEATHTGWVELPDDTLSADNKRYFTLQSLRSIKVHAVSDRARVQNRYETAETFFLKAAIAAGSRAVPIDFTESESVPDAGTLARTDVLVLANVARLSAEAARRVKAYVAGGGGLIVTLGENIDADSYTEQLGGETGLMPCNLVRPVGDAFDRDQFRVLATVRYEHPIFVPFKEPNHGDFGKARVYRFFQAVPTENATVLASYDDGSPALFEKPYGDLGRVLCFTSTIDRDWNDLPIRAVYLPFLHEAIKYLALKNVESVPDHRVGDTLEIPVSRDGAGTNRGAVAVFDPNGVETRMQGDTAQGSVFYRDTRIPGIYSVHRSDTELTDYFVVNVETSESDLAARDVEELASLLKGAAAEAPVDTPTGELVAQYREDVERNQNVWIYLMIAVFALAVAEMFIANRV